MRSRPSGPGVSLELCRRRVSFLASSAASANTFLALAALLLVLVARFEDVFSMAFFAPARGRPFGQPRFFGPSEDSLVAASLIAELGTVSSGGVRVWRGSWTYLTALAGCILGGPSVTATSSLSRLSLMALGLRPAPSLVLCGDGKFAEGTWLGCNWGLKGGSNGTCAGCIECEG